VVESTGLLNRRTGITRTAGSNPALSAIITNCLRIFLDSWCQIGDSYTMKTDAKPAPIRVKRGHVTVSIYRLSSLSGSQRYEQFVVVYYQGQRRVRRKFSDLKKAKQEAELIASRLVSGEAEALKLNGKDRSIYLHALDQLKPYQKPLNVAITEYVEALKVLPDGTTLLEAVQAHQKATKTIQTRKDIKEVVDEYLAGKTNAGRSERHLGDLKSRLGRFSEALQMPMHLLDASIIQEYLDSIKGTGRTRLNYLRPIIALVRYAVRKKYASRDLLDEIESIEKPEAKPGKTEIFTPSELDEILTSIRTELVPWIAIGAFAGLRTAELLRLDWKDIHLDRSFIVMQAGNAKTGARRIVPLCQRAIDLLKDHDQEAGPFKHHKSEGKYFTRLVADMNEARRRRGITQKFKWRQNALRHSYCSYRLAVTQDAAKTALEAGNSQAMIFRHYRELVTEDAAKEWFELVD